MPGKSAGKKIPFGKGGFNNGAEYDNYCQHPKSNPPPFFKGGRSQPEQLLAFRCVVASLHEMVFGNKKARAVSGAGNNKGGKG